MFEWRWGVEVGRVLADLRGVSAKYVWMASRCVRVNIHRREEALLLFSVTGHDYDIVRCKKPWL